MLAILRQSLFDVNKTIVSHLLLSYPYVVFFFESSAIYFSLSIRSFLINYNMNVALVSNTRNFHSDTRFYYEANFKSALLTLQPCIARVKSSYAKQPDNFKHFGSFLRKSSSSGMFPNSIPHSIKPYFSNLHHWVWFKDTPDFKLSTGYLA